MTNIYGTKPVFLFNGTRAIRINLADVVYAKAHHVQCILVMADGTHHQLPYPLGHLQNMLPQSAFVRIHRQYIINVWHMQMFIGSYIRMDNGDSLTMGKTYSNVLNAHIMVISQCADK